MVATPQPCQCQCSAGLQREATPGPQHNRPLSGRFSHFKVVASLPWRDMLVAMAARASSEAFFAFCCCLSPSTRPEYLEFDPSALRGTKGCKCNCAGLHSYPHEKQYTHVSRLTFHRSNAGAWRHVGLGMAMLAITSCRTCHTDQVVFK